MNKIIVTGGAGFIGSAIVNRLNELGHDDILIVDRLDETDKWKNLPPLRFSDYLDRRGLHAPQQLSVHAGPRTLGVEAGHTIHLRIVGRDVWRWICGHE